MPDTRGLFTKFPLVRKGGGGVDSLAPSTTTTLDRLDNAHAVILTPTADITLKIPVASEAYVGEEYQLRNASSLYRVTVTDTADTAVIVLRPGDAVDLRSDDVPAWNVVTLRNGRELWTFPTGGQMVVASDGAQTNGGSMMGDIALTEAAAAYAVVYSVTDDAFALLSATIAGFTEVYTADYQPFPDTSEAGDYVAFGHTVPFAELAFNLSATVADYTLGEVAWEYWDGTAWTALTIALDNTGTTATDGSTSFQRDGAIVFVPPSDWASSSLNGTTAYWIRCIVVTALTTEPAFAGQEHHFVRSADPFVATRTGTVVRVRVIDQTTGTRHTANDVKFQIVDITKGTSSGELAFAQDKYQDAFTVSFEVDRGDSLAIIVTQEDGTNEVVNPIFQLDVIARDE